jgi:hypothetical protein
VAAVVRDTQKEFIKGMDNISPMVVRTIQKKATPRDSGRILSRK